jgi:tRNA-splicing ligase RtcB
LFAFETKGEALASDDGNKAIYVGIGLHLRTPHGAGRNKSRTQLLRELGLSGLTPDAYLARSRALLEQQTRGLDERFFYDQPDISETPIAYKSAATVRAQIDHFGLAEVVAKITPLGCLMAGDYDKP